MSQPNQNTSESVEISNSSISPSDVVGANLQPASIVAVSPPEVQENLAIPSHIRPKHFTEWVEGSGVNPRIVDLSRSLRSRNNRTVVAQRLGWKRYSDDYSLGWFISGVDLKTMQPQAFGQYKPDDKIQLPEEDKPRKYISDKGHPYDAIALPHATDEDYWQRILDDPTIPISPIEGPKKAGCLMTLGFASLALCGVTMGLKKGGKELVDNLNLVAVQGRPIIIPFDSDLATNINVQRALKALATILKAKGCVVFVAIIPLELESKAIDDVWANHGPDMVHKIMADAIPYSQWLKGLEAQTKESAVSEKMVLAEPKKPATNVKLSMQEAADQAREILLSGSSELAINIKLEELRQKAVIGDYTWENKIIKPLKRDMDGERFKLELLALMQMDDPVERCRQIALLAPKYSMGASTIKEAMAAMKSRTQTAEVKVLSFDDLLASESEALEWRVPELLPVGETVLFVALPKVGKSKAAVDLAFCVATGESRFLGREVKQGKVLLICPDASKQSLKHEMLKRGFRSGDGKNIRIIPRWSIDQMSVLEKELEDFRPDLVIIDSLKKITAGKEISENSAEFADNIIALNDMLGRYRASGVLIHHSSKSNEAVGVAKARGSTAIVGACWGVWDLERISKPDPNNKKKPIYDPKCPKRIFTATSRDSEGLSLNIKFNPENNSWDFISEAGVDDEEASQQMSNQERILKVLRENNRSLSGREVMELMGLDIEQNKSKIYATLTRMENKRLISSKPSTRDKRCILYSLPNFESGEVIGTVPATQEISLPPPPPPVTMPDVDYYPENHTQYTFQDSQHNSQHIVNTHDACEPLQITETLTSQSVNPVVNTHPLTGGGRGVEVNSTSTTGTQQTSLAQTPAQIDDAVAKLKLAQMWTAVYEIMGGADKAELREQLKQILPPDERKRIGTLHAGAIKTKGTRCRYTGQEYAEQLGGGLDLVVAQVDLCKAYHLTEITCSKPDGSYTTRLKPSELNAFF